MSLIESITSDIQKLNSKIEQEKKTALKLRKKIRNNWILYSYSSSKSLKINQQKTEIMELGTFRNQVKNF